jgi:hypothetical protein
MPGQDALEGLMVGLKRPVLPQRFPAIHGPRCTTAPRSSATMEPLWN